MLIGILNCCLVQKGKQLISSYSSRIHATNLMLLHMFAHCQTLVTDIYKEIASD